MSISIKRNLLLKGTNANAISASNLGASGSLAQSILAMHNIEGFRAMDIIVHCSATACSFPYKIQVSTKRDITSYWVDVTSTNVVANSAGAITLNKISNEHSPWIRIVMTSATDVLVAGTVNYCITSNDN